MAIRQNILYFNYLIALKKPLLFLHICNIDIHLLFWYLTYYFYTVKGDTHVKGSKGISGLK